MATIRLISLLMFIVFALCTLRIRVGVGASPTIDAASASKSSYITGKIESVTAQDNSQQQVADLSATQNGLSATSSQQQAKSHGQVVANGSKHLKANNAEKLKRGLTNFMNHLNPAPYFVPTQLVGASSASSASSQAEPASIVNHGPSADVLLKGPSRHVQARPIGGPLRWGRRR